METQEDLAGYLTEAGYAVTQATVSRDIRELSLEKSSRSKGSAEICDAKHDSGGGGDQTSRSTAGKPVCDTSSRWHCFDGTGGESACHKNRSRDGDGGRCGAGCDGN